jgi:hypothetical protein
MPLSRLYVLPLPRQLVAISAPKWLLLTVACFGTFFPGAWSPEKLQMRSFHAWNSSTLPDRRANVKKAGKAEFKRRSGSLWCVVFLPLTSNNFLRCVTGRTLWKLSEIRNVYKTIIDILKVKFAPVRSSFLDAVAMLYWTNVLYLFPVRYQFQVSPEFSIKHMSHLLYRSILISTMLKASRLSWSILFSWENYASSPSSFLMMPK